MKLELMTYTPTEIETDVPLAPRIVLVALPVRTCSICTSPMVSLPKQSTMASLFKIEAQLERGHIHIASGDVDTKGETICTVCSEAGRAQFICSTCGGIRTTDQVAERCGEPPEFVCALCYATMPAKAYDEALERLQEAHRYDYE